MNRYYFIVIFFVSIFFNAFKSYPDLLSYYKLEGDLNDSSGNGYHLQVGDNFVYNWVESLSGTCIEIPLQISYDRKTTTPNVEGLYYPGTGGWTVMGWIFIEQGRHGYIAHQYTPYITGHEPYRLCVWDSGEFFFHIEDGNGNKVETRFPISNFLGKWVHVAGVYEFKKYVKLYINGELKDSTSTTRIPETLTNYSTHIGGNTWGNDQGVTMIDEVRLYNHALSKSEIRYAMSLILPEIWQDDDGDGVPNIFDFCPNSDLNALTDNNGCLLIRGDITGDGSLNLDDSIKILDSIIRR